MLSYNESDELFVGDEMLDDFANCLDCGICCKFFTDIVAYDKEIESLICKLDISLQDFIKSHVKKTDRKKGLTAYVLKTPCSFLHDNSCKIYHNRFLVCRIFPFIINLTTNDAILTGIYLCPQSTQFYEGMLDYYQKNYKQLYQKLIEMENKITVDNNGMQINGSMNLFSPYLDWLIANK